MPRSVLCVSDSKEIHKMCRTSFSADADSFDVTYVSSLSEALKVFNSNLFEVVVVDSCMRGNQGLTFLGAIMQNAPFTNRIAITDERTQHYLQNTLHLVHQWVAQREIISGLIDTIEKVLLISDACGSDDIKAFIATVEVIPTIPTIYSDMLDILNDPDASIVDVGRLISSDIAMTAKVLQLVNSAFFGLCRKIYTAEEAAVFIGIETLKGMVLSFQALTALSVQGIPQAYIDEMWQHAVTTAAFARSIAQCETNSRELIDSAFTAGMLHDIGRLLLMDNMPVKYKEYMKMIMNDNSSEVKLERVIFGATHYEVGAYMLKEWGLPNSIVEPVLLHHSSFDVSQGYFSPVTAVIAADCLYYDLVGTGGVRPRSKALPNQGNVSYFKAEKWMKACAKVLG